MPWDWESDVEYCKVCDGVLAFKGTAGELDRFQCLRCGDTSSVPTTGHFYAALVTVEQSPMSIKNDDVEG